MMRKVLVIALIVTGLIHIGFAQEETPTEQLLGLALTQNEVREVLGEGNESWVLESSGAEPRPPSGAIGISSTFTQGAQSIRIVMYEFDLVDRGGEFIENGIDSVLASLTADPVDAGESFIDPDDPDAGPKVALAVLLSYRDEGDTQLIYLRGNPNSDTGVVVLLRSNLNETQILDLGRLQLAKLIEAGK